ncbi:uncharacterized protein LY89DRAFT_679317 [Mollisia scopiformis]|uniref:Uncharacterized protein n=1 Tax=Mollisia scopiformis TaxID=149040 RepID=A0A194XVA1_MOLSC|nr:uncharacterized protein LY89DRAFT_679317 [Mollisia scopiformis]KUJ24066.1 hypothetical protein LY89DRAFT_679317 [Mollisia scopiformis]
MLYIVQLRESRLLAIASRDCATLTLLAALSCAKWPVDAQQGDSAHDQHLHQRISRLCTTVPPASPEAEKSGGDIFVLRAWSLTCIGVGWSTVTSHLSSHRSGLLMS